MCSCSGVYTVIRYFRLCAAMDGVLVWLSGIPAALLQPHSSSLWLQWLADWSYIGYSATYSSAVWPLVGWLCRSLHAAPSCSRIMLGPIVCGAPVLTTSSCNLLFVPCDARYTASMPHTCLQARATLGILAHPLWYLIAMVLVIECLASPIPALSDAAVMSAASTDGCYGSCRMWACLTWNAAGVISSLVMRISDDSSVFAIYAASSSLAVISACYLDMSLIPSRQTISTTPEPVACHSQAAAEPEASSLTGRGHDHEQESSESEAHEPLLSTCTRSPASPAAASQDGSTAPDAKIVLNDADTNHFFDTTGPGRLEEDALARSTQCALHAAGVHHTSPGSGRLPEKLATLLRDRRVIVFLARAMLMGVRSWFKPVNGRSSTQGSLLLRMSFLLGCRPVVASVGSCF